MTPCAGGVKGGESITAVHKGSYRGGGVVVML